jgi:GcrA cell cycle regulator
VSGRSAPTQTRPDRFTQTGGHRSALSTRACERDEIVAPLCREVFRDPPVACCQLLFELSPGCCRWPIGEPDDLAFRWCGALVIHGCPYCLKHQAESRDPGASPFGGRMSRANSPPVVQARDQPTDLSVFCTSKSSRNSNVVDGFGCRASRRARAYRGARVRLQPNLGADFATRACGWRSVRSRRLPARPSARHGCRCSGRSRRFEVAAMPDRALQLCMRSSKSRLPSRL